MQEKWSYEVPVSDVSITGDNAQYVFLLETWHRNVVHFVSEEMTIGWLYHNLVGGMSLRSKTVDDKCFNHD